MRKKGFTLIELLVVISIIAMLLAILMPALNKVKKIAMRVVCATNLKGMGTAQMVYANDYDDDYVVQGGGNNNLQWLWSTPGFQNATMDWRTQGTGITIGASLYLLVREADVSPKSFVCPSGDEKEYDGTNDNTLDLVELWDFGAEDYATGSGYPYQHVSYAYQMPYGLTGGRGSHAASGSMSAAFAMMADKNPYLDPKIATIGAGTSENWMQDVTRMGAYYVTNSTMSQSSWEVKRANTYSHGRDGQNVLFGDGHASYEKTTDVGAQNDAIYLPVGGSAPDPQAPVRMGYYGALAGAPVHVLTTTQPVTANDSFLVNDDVHSALQHPL